MAIKDPVARKAYAKAHYEANKPRYLAAAKQHNSKQRDALRIYLYQFLLTHPCIDCGEPDPVVLEFDHRDGTDKKFNIGDVTANGYSLRRVSAEVEKCDVRCANCHRRRTAKQLSWFCSTDIEPANDNDSR